MRELVKVSEDIIGGCPTPNCSKEYSEDNPMVRIFDQEACADCWEDVFKFIILKFNIWRNT